MAPKMWLLSLKPTVAVSVLMAPQQLSSGGTTPLPMMYHASPISPLPRCSHISTLVTHSTHPGNLSSSLPQ
eukprot:14529205-Ditylum_brightwellii.AAC.1